MSIARMAAKGGNKKLNRLSMYNQTFARSQVADGSGRFQDEDEPAVEDVIDEAAAERNKDVLLLCDEVEGGIGDFVSALSELMNWKDDVLAVSALPSVILTRLIVIVSKLCRAKNSMQKKGMDVVRAARDFSSGLQQTAEYQTLQERGDRLSLELRQTHTLVRQLKARHAREQARSANLEGGHRAFRWYRMCMQLLSMEQRLIDKRKWHAAHARVKALQKQLDSTKQLLVRSKLEVASYKNRLDASGGGGGGGGGGGRGHRSAMTAGSLGGGGSGSGGLDDDDDDEEDDNLHEAAIIASGLGGESSSSSSRRTSSLGSIAEGGGGGGGDGHQKSRQASRLLRRGGSSGGGIGSGSSDDESSGDRGSRRRLSSAQQQGGGGSSSRRKQSSARRVSTVESGTVAALHKQYRDHISKLEAKLVELRKEQADDAAARAAAAAKAAAANAGGGAGGGSAVGGGEEKASAAEGAGAGAGSVAEGGREMRRRSNARMRAAERRRITTDVGSTLRSARTGAGGGGGGGAGGAGGRGSPQREVRSGGDSSRRGGDFTPGGSVAAAGAGAAPAVPEGKKDYFLLRLEEADRKRRERWESKRQTMRQSQQQAEEMRLKARGFMARGVTSPPGNASEAGGEASAGSVGGAGAGPGPGAGPGADGGVPAIPTGPSADPQGSDFVQRRPRSSLDRARAGQVSRHVASGAAGGAGEPGGGPGRGLGGSADVGEAPPYETKVGAAGGMMRPQTAPMDMPTAAAEEAMARAGARAGAGAAGALVDGLSSAAETKQPPPPFGTNDAGDDFVAEGWGAGDDDTQAAVAVLKPQKPAGDKQPGEGRRRTTNVKFGLGVDAAAAGAADASAAPSDAPASRRRLPLAATPSGRRITSVSGRGRTKTNVVQKKA